MTTNIMNTLSSPLKNTLSHDVKSKTAPLVDIHNTDPKMLKLDKKAVNKEADVVFSDRSLKMQAISKDFFQQGG
ncbi:hypothetical protein [Psychromonas sp. CD1]|uniref:hypothetical protein n=1 Tax=Psychromonas sp. CD1 TaxID=1979839 RepID=UPI000B9BDF63|nr:hypothetical protein [Psychromonas sp. CD1]